MGNDTIGLSDADFLRMIGCRVRTGQIGTDLQGLRALYAKRLRAIAETIEQPVRIVEEGPPVTKARELGPEEVAVVTGDSGVYVDHTPGDAPDADSP